MQSIDTAAVWRSAALVEPAVAGNWAVGVTRRGGAAAASTPSVGTGAVGHTAANHGEAMQANPMMQHATFDNAAKNKAVKFAATPATGYGNRPRGAPLS